MSWAQLITIRDEARKIAQDERTAPLVDCPIDGTRLEVRDGIYNCPMGNFTTRNPLRAQA